MVGIQSSDDTVEEDVEKESDDDDLDGPGWSWPSVTVSYWGPDIVDEEDDRGILLGVKYSWSSFFLEMFLLDLKLKTVFYTENLMIKPTFSYQQN